MKHHLLGLMILGSLPAWSQSGTDPEIVVVDFKALKNDVYTVGNRVYQPSSASDGLVEVKLKITNESDVDRVMDLTKVMLEGSGVAREPMLILTNAPVHFAQETMVKLKPKDSKERKLIFSFPGYLSPTNLLVDNKKKIPLAEDLKDKPLYFDSDWNRVDSPDGAAYYRLTTQADASWLIRDHSLSTGLLVRESELSSLYPEVKSGLTTHYHENGNIREKGSYANNKKKGLFLKYFDDGSIESKTEYSEKGARYLQVWNPAGDSLLRNGSGTVEKTNSDGEPEIMTYSEHKLRSIMSIRNAQNDTLYALMDRMPEYTGGMTAFANHVSQTLTYPKEAKRNRIEGRVGLRFVIDKEGNIDEIETFDGIGYGCDQEAVRVLSSSGRWVPGAQNGLAVKSSMALFINFTL